MATRIKLETSTSLLEFDANNLRLCSMRPKESPEQDFIKFDESHPTFEIGYYDDKKRYRLLSSFSASKVNADNPSPGIYTATFGGFKDIDIIIECRVSVQPGDRFVRFSVSVENRCGLNIADIQYPFVICRYKLNGTAGTESIVLPHGYGSGRLWTGDLEYGGSIHGQRLRPDSYLAWEFCPREGDCDHYPGMIYAQFLAYYNDKAGIYLACDDTKANIKKFRVLHRKPGMRLGVSHAGDWDIKSRKLEYDTILTTFEGDWYDAADIYRDWSINQDWFVPLTKKKNIPEWLLDSPAYITVRSGGQLDTGDVTEIKEFLPYEKCIPMLQDIADKINSSLCVIFMGWERAGSWVYPDCFPPLGGEESMKNAIAMIKARGWHAGSFNSGTRWCFNQLWSKYDGREYLDSLEAESGYCKTAEGDYWLERWDQSFRMSFTGCLGTEKMRETALEIIGRQIGWGMEALQYLDQNNGASTFPCFAEEHGHPYGPGKWMHESMTRFVNDMYKLAGEKGAYNVIHSAESGLNEVCLPLFPQTELRVYPDDYGVDYIPLYQYLFHECVILQGMMGFGPEPYHLVIKNATNFILGGIPGGVLTGDGTLLDKDTSNWALWEPKVENSENALELIRTTLAMRRGSGRDFLVFGRMMRPAKVKGIERVSWRYGNRGNNYASIFHSAWQSPDGRHAVALANWTDTERCAIVCDNRFDPARGLKLIICGIETVETFISNSPEGLNIIIPPLGCAMIIQ